MSSLSLYWTGRLEWTSWAQLALSVRSIFALPVKALLTPCCSYLCKMQMFSQVSYMAVPSYNFPLGFWGCYCSYSKNGRAVFAYLVFLVLSILVDIIWMGEWGGGNGQVYNFFQCGTTGDVLTVGGHVCHTNQFALVMLIFNMLTKVSYANNHKQPQCSIRTCPLPLPQMQLVAIFFTYQLFVELGGAHSMRDIAVTNEYVSHEGDGSDPSVATGAVGGGADKSASYSYQAGSSYQTEALSSDNPSYRDI